MSFRLFSKKMETPLQAAYRERLLARTLTEEEKEMAAYPLEQWRQADRTALKGYCCRVASPVSLAFLTPFDAQHPLLRRVAIHKGPVVDLALDAIVNAANEACLGGGGVDGAIHSAAGPLLQRECATFSGCPTGECLITKGYNLPARYVIHTVGPVGEREELLRCCYRNVLDLAAVDRIETIGLCGISTGVYGYPLRAAARVATEEVCAFLKHNTTVRMVCFACFKSEEVDAITEALKLCN
ncbi:Appr-1-p processing domain-containing protein [Strigomonas culicis]|uniref:Appr-1-p processing domain-containing protein n=1 Tax=Strigomonas culicis TaxID=28005 RepID=S9VYK0_9TRYP|nr:Appr-1-p processing domain-containing protein [Strigomonas culicis]EPY32156.1 Appr-1-p processing domain-containing protein [Strigomonas culicis]|eukprot:EPY23877.1 Appr-1-p processing domain-containing protein [Strigomonas culicis]